MIIPTEHYTEEKIVKLTQAQIEELIRILNYQQHSLFVYMEYQKIIDKLNDGKAVTQETPEEPESHSEKQLREMLERKFPQLKDRGKAGK